MKYLEPRKRGEESTDKKKYKIENSEQSENTKLRLKIKSTNREKEISLKEREKALIKKERDLEDVKNDFEKENNEFMEQKEKIKKLLDEKIKDMEKLEQEKEKIKKENSILIKYKSENDEKDKLIQNKEDLLNQQNEEIIKLNQELQQRENDLKEKEESLKNKEDLLNQQNEEILELKQKLQKKENDLIDNEKELNNNKYLIENEKDINNKEELIKNNIAEKNLELIKKEQLLNEKEKALNDLELKLKGEVILIGLNNIGATCYMNATLQCFSNTKKLTNYFLKNYQAAPNKIMSNEYAEVVKNLWNRDNNNKSYSPNSFKEVLSKENPLFAGIAANDSKDLINFLLEKFHKELNLAKSENIIDNDSNNNQPDQTNEQLMLKIFLEEYKAKFNSPISNLFYGILETKSQCQGCNVIKFNFQVFSFIEFPLQQVNQYFFNKGKRALLTAEGKNPDVDLYECFEYNGKIDLMTGENQMYCNQCNKLCNAYYSTILYSGPNYLIINLNRGKGAVYECNVIFPEILNLINCFTFKHGITVYELYAVICHLGPSSMSGHFVAYCRNRIDNKWYLYNDAIVSLCTRPQQYTEGMPYILFYKALKAGQNSDY